MDDKPVPPIGLMAATVLTHAHGFFRGTRWVGGPIWWQVGAGMALLLLMEFWTRRVLHRAT